MIVTTFDNLAHALPIAYAQAPCGVAYVPGKGWRSYDLTNGAPVGTVPEFLVMRPGDMPVPLNNDAGEALWSLVLSLVSTRHHNHGEH